MKITFVAIGWENLAVSLLSAIAKKEGHETNLAFSAGLFNDRYNLSIPPLASLFDDTKDVLAAVDTQKPDVLAFSCLTANYQWMLSIAEKVKKNHPNIKTIFGGIHPSAIGKTIFQYPQVDYVCIGEGDFAFPAILRHIKNPDDQIQLPNTLYRNSKDELIESHEIGFTQNLDDLPIFDKTIWEEHVDLSKIYFTLATRGCPYSCSFCFNSFYSKLHGDSKKNYIRQRSPQHMMKELIWAKNRYNLKIIEFEDDVFTLNKTWLKEFLHEYKKEIHLPFQCLSHPKYMNEEIAKILADAGCIFVQLGIQSMDDDYKRAFINRFDTSQDVERSLAAMKKYNIQVKVDHMFGLPNEPLSAQEKAKAMYQKYPPYRVQTFWINFMPKTEITNFAYEEGLITQEEFENILEGKGGDYYRNSTAIKEPKKLKFYKAYEMVFKLIPVLPSSLIKKIDPEKFLWMPTFLIGGISFLCDAFCGLFKRNPDHIAYIRYYSYHLYKSILKNFGIKAPPATRPNLIQKDNKQHSSQEFSCT